MSKKTVPDHQKQSFEDAGSFKSYRRVQDIASTALSHLFYFDITGTLPTDIIENDFGEPLWNNEGSILTET